MRDRAGRGTAGAACLLVLAFGLVPGGGASAAPVVGVDVLYTSDADFERGRLQDVNHDVPAHDQLQLNRSQTFFRYVNVAASSRGTVMRIDGDTGKVVGEWWTSPTGRERNPSRTTVDRFGNVWVSNRAEGGDGRGSVTRIGVVDGGTRVDADGSPNPSGDYLKPPFTYNTCQDRGVNGQPGDGLIATSRGRSASAADIRPWTNAGGADTSGGVSTAEDECIITYTRTAGRYVRTVAVDGNNDIWVGGYPDGVHEKVSGLTGLPVPGTQIDYGCGGYGGLVDRNGVLWSANYERGQLLRFDPATASGRCLDRSHGDYGLGLDSTTGEIWHTAHQGDRVVRMGPDGSIRGVYQHGSAHAQGVVVDDESNVWVASSLYGSTVGHLRTDGTWVGSITVGSGPTGIAVDSNGKVWVTNINSNTVVRIDPAAGQIGADGSTPVGAVDLTVPLGDGAGPYNYSDMTGSVLGEITSPVGTWTTVQDAGRDQVPWGTVTWNAEAQGTVPVGAAITVEARVADTEGLLSAAEWFPVENGVSFFRRGRLLEVKATLAPDASGASPILSDLRVQTVNDPPAVDAGTDVDGNEGSAIALDGTVTDGDPDAAVATSWSYQPVSGVDEGATCSFADPAVADTTVTCTDDGVYRFTLTATDTFATTTDAVQATVGNVAPDITAISLRTDPVPVGAAVVIEGTFDDPGGNDTHQVAWDWGDGESTPVASSVGRATGPATHRYSAPGVYRICLTVSDDDEADDRECAPSQVVVYDRGAGFVTGGGWLDAPSSPEITGALRGSPAGGRVSFGLVSKYQNGASRPTGNTQVQVRSGDLNFHAETYDWLIVTGSKAVYRGTGRVNGVAGYEFLVSVVDGGKHADADRFRIKIWDPESGQVLYDTQPGAADEAPPISGLGGGSIVIHS